jgi:hypothetical protein
MKATKFNEGRSLQEPSVQNKSYCNNVSEVIHELQKGKINDRDGLQREKGELKSMLFPIPQSV